MNPKKGIERILERDPQKAGGKPNGLSIRKSSHKGPSSLGRKVRRGTFDISRNHNQKEITKEEKHALRLQGSDFKATFSIYSLHIKLFYFIFLSCLDFLYFLKKKKKFFFLA